MIRLSRFALLLPIAIAFCGSLSAQTEKVVTVKMLDGKTGEQIKTSDFLVRIDHQSNLHADWVAHNEDGSTKLTLPAKAALLSMQGTYESSMQIYVNCDTDVDKDNSADRWYALADILTAGVVTPNGCIKHKEKEKPKDKLRLNPIAKPGEFIFFVRKPNIKEQLNDYSSK